MRPHATASALAAGVLAASSAFAQESPLEVARRDLISQAEQASTAGDHARAAELAGRASQIRVTPSIQYFLAREHQQLNHPVETLAFAGGCARAAEADLTLRNREAIMQACREIVTATEGRVGRLTVHLPSPAPSGVSVRVGSTDVPPTLVGVPIPVAPGAVSVEVSGAGFEAFRREVQVVAGQAATVDVTLTPTSRTPSRPAATAATAPGEPITPPVAPPPRGPGVGPWIVAGAGVATLALSGVFYGLAMSARSDRDAACVGGCDPVAREHDDSYAGRLTATSVTLAVGGVAVAAGVTWFLVARARGSSSSGRTAMVHWGVAPTAGGAAVGLGGSF